MKTIKITLKEVTEVEREIAIPAYFKDKTLYPDKSLMRTLFFKLNDQFDCDTIIIWANGKMSLETENGLKPNFSTAIISDTHEFEAALLEVQQYAKKLIKEEIESRNPASK